MPTGGTPPQRPGDPPSPPSQRHAFSYAQATRRGILPTVPSTSISSLPPPPPPQSTNFVTRSFEKFALVVDLQHIRKPFQEAADDVADVFSDLGATGLDLRAGTKSVIVAFASEQDLHRALDHGCAIGPQMAPVSRCIPRSSSVLKVNLHRLPIDMKPMDTATKIKEYFESTYPNRLRVLDVRIQMRKNLVLPHGSAILDITGHEEVKENFPRTIVLFDRAIVLEWTGCPQYCTYCDNAGHSIQDCERRPRRNSEEKGPNKRRMVGDDNAHVVHVHSHTQSHTQRVTVAQNPTPSSRNTSNAPVPTSTRSTESQRRPTLAGSTPVSSTKATSPSTITSRTPNTALNTQEVSMESSDIESLLTDLEDAPPSGEDRSQSTDEMEVDDESGVATRTRSKSAKKNKKKSKPSKKANESSPTSLPSRQ